MKQTIRVFTSRLACFVVAAVLLAAGAAWIHAAFVSTAKAANQATITSDKPDYHPGEIVTLTGNGWKPGELVTIVMSVNPFTHSDVTLTAIADANGNLKNSDYIVQKTDLGVTFHVQATGASGDVAPLLTFTDSISAPTSIGTGTRSSAGTVSTFPTTVTAAVPVGNTIIVSAVVSAASTVTISMSDSGGNTYTKDADVTSTTGPTRTLIFSAPVTTALTTSSTITLSFSTAEKDIFVSAFQVSGLVSASRVDQTKTNTGTNSTALSTGATATTAQGDELLFAAFGVDFNSGTPTVTAGTGYTALTTALTSGVWGIYPEYQIVNTTGAYNATGTLSAAQLAWAAGLVTYKALPGSKLVFTTSPVNITAGACSPAITVQSQDTNSTPASPLSTETIALSTSGTGGVFYSDAACSTVITSITIGTTADTVSVYWADSVAGSPVITASGTGAFTSAPTQTETVTVNPTPTITTLSPSSAVAGAAAQTLTINGTGFITTSAATYNGAVHTVTYVSATQITIPLTAADQAAAGTYPVVVTNPAPGGGASNTVNFSITNAAPTISSISPTSALVGAAAQTLTINGTGYNAASTVTYNGVAHAATFVTNIKLTIQLSASDQATVGTYPVVVTNPTPGGGSSSPVNFSVNNPVPTVSTLSPTSALAGAAAQTLTINGTNFLATSTATYNAVAHTVTYVSPTQLTIPLSASDQATAGTYPVVVTNPAPGGGSSTAVNFTVNNLVPTITTLSPTSANVGAAAQTLTINGTNFLSTSTVTYNAVAHTPTFVNTTQLTIPLTAADQATAGNFNVVVTNPTPGGGASSPAVFTVNNLVPTITSLSPNSANVGAASQVVTITGTNFVSTSTATYNGVTHAVTFTNSTTIKITLTATDQAVAGTYNVIVTNPTPGGGASNASTFTVNNLAPTITSLSPTSASVGAAAQTLTINGTNFVATSTATYNSVAHAVTFVSATKITIQLSASDQATQGSYPVVVTNPPPAGGSSAAVNFVVGQAPVITSPNTATFLAGTAGSFQMTATGNPAPTFTLTAGTIPAGLTLSSSGLISGTASGGQTQVVTITASNGITPNGTQSLTIQVNEAPFIDDTTTSISGAVGSPISFQFFIDWGTPSTGTWTETGALPSGVTLSTSGLLSGTPTSVGTFSILVQFDNGVPPAATENFTISVGKAATYTQPFNTGHGWTYTTISCSTEIGTCSTNANDTTAADCSTAPCVEAQEGDFLSGSLTGYYSHAYTWVQLGVPSQANVVSVDGSFWDKSSGCTSGANAGMDIYDSTNTIDIVGSQLEGPFTVNGDTGTTHGNNGAKSIAAAYQGPNTTITLRFDLNPVASTSTCKIMGDNYNLTISYIPANGHRVIVAKAFFDHDGRFLGSMLEIAQPKHSTQATE